MIMSRVYVRKGEGKWKGGEEDEVGETKWEKMKRVGKMEELK